MSSTQRAQDRSPEKLLEKFWNEEEPDGLDLERIVEMRSGVVFHGLNELLLLGRSDSRERNKARQVIAHALGGDMDRMVACAADLLGSVDDGAVRVGNTVLQSALRWHQGLSGATKQVVLEAVMPVLIAETGEAQRSSAAPVPSFASFSFVDALYALQKLQYPPSRPFLEWLIEKSLGEVRTSAASTILIAGLLTPRERTQVGSVLAEFIEEHPSSIWTSPYQQEPSTSEVNTRVRTILERRGIATDDVVAVLVKTAPHLPDALASILGRLPTRDSRRALQSLRDGPWARSWDVAESVRSAMQASRMSTAETHGGFVDLTMRRGWKPWSHDAFIRLAEDFVNSSHSVRRALERIFGMALSEVAPCDGDSLRTSPVAQHVLDGLMQDEGVRTRFATFAGRCRGDRARDVAMLVDPEMSPEMTAILASVLPPHSRVQNRPAQGHEMHPG